MKQEERKKLVEYLKREKKNTEEKIEVLKELTQPIAPDCSYGRVSRMDAINNKSVNEAALRNAQEKLLKIKHTLEKSEDPKFGICRNCGNPIPMGRLLVMPGSSMCVSCAGSR